MTERVEEIRRQVGYWIKCAVYNQPLMGVEWERPENQRWLDVADKIIEFCAAALAQAEQIADEFRDDVAQARRGELEGDIAKAEREREELHNTLDAYNQLADKVIRERDAARAEVERLKGEVIRWEQDAIGADKARRQAEAALARVRAALEKLESVATEAHVTANDPQWNVIERLGRAIDGARAALAGR